jgi:hypothetical protein
MTNEDDIERWWREVGEAFPNRARAAGMIRVPRICPLCRLEDCTCEGTD